MLTRFLREWEKIFCTYSGSCYKTHLWILCDRISINNLKQVLWTITHTQGSVLLVDKKLSRSGHIYETLSNALNGMYVIFIFYCISYRYVTFDIVVHLGEVCKNYLVVIISSSFNRNTTNLSHNIENHIWRKTIGSRKLNLSCGVRKVGHI